MPSVSIELGCLVKGDYDLWWCHFTDPKDLWVGVGDLRGRPKIHWSIGLRWVYCSISIYSYGYPQGR